ncbi:hypothetical protein GWK47_012247 [Chionoecetes opilio]|uniref:Uncharacterized protein n=1 Tax=Chionoecetes opilio TaxID=41210 RepID=A0A8J4Y1F7_CHIOP|nr:hypothetical protein GWK47_012247 [Chionoecetes opilio]
MMINDKVALVMNGGEQEACHGAQHNTASCHIMVCKIIHVCGMLHNICKDRNINIPVDEEYGLVGEAEDDVARRAVVRARRAVPLPQAVRRNADRLYRDEFSYLHFSNEV